MIILGPRLNLGISSPLMYLWPLLYVAHAIMIVADIPPVNKISGGLNMFIGVWVYGFLTGLVAYIYSRYVLHKLKKTARIELTDNNEHGEALSE